MRAKITPASAVDARSAVPAAGTVRVLRFGHGLDLWVYPSGLKTWRCKVQRGGKRTTLNLGYFPEMSIDDAQAARVRIRIAPDPSRALNIVDVWNVTTRRDGERLIDANEVARMLGSSPSVIRKMAALPKVKVGTLDRWRVGDVENWKTTVRRRAAR